MVSFTDEPVRKYVKPQVKTTGGFDFTEVDNMLGRDYVQGTEIIMTRNITPSGESAQEVKITDGTTIAQVDATTTALKVYNVGSVDIQTSLIKNGTEKYFYQYSGTATVYTVPADKYFIVTAAQVGYDGTASSMNFQTSGSVNKYVLYAGAGLVGSALSQPLIKLVAGDKIVITETGSVWGYEVATTLFA